MADESKEVHNQQSGSHSQSGHSSPTHSSERGSSEKKGELGRENQAGQQPPKKDVRSDEKNQERQKTGSK